MKISEALIDAVMGYAVVFLGIALLVLVVVLMGKLMTAKKPAPAAAAPASKPAAVPPAPKEELPKAPGAAGDLKLYDTPDATAAMIMAIVADELKVPVNELRFISIKEVHRK